MFLLDAIAQVESDNRPAPGDHGKALSRYQIHKEVWQDVHRKFGLKLSSPRVDVGSRFEDIAGTSVDAEIRARNCASVHIGIIEEYLQKHGMATTAENIYVCWNLGCTGFKRRHFSVAECPAATIKNAKEVARLAKVERGVGILPVGSKSCQK